ncbi:MAG TPA: hypothetical protein VM510_07025 [Caulifigura sp.]|nr:hypothetical protein [Caulifigura sp.]
MSTSALNSAVQGLDAVLVDAGLLMQKISLGAPLSSASVERVCALVAQDVQRRILEIAKLRPNAAAVSRLRERRETLGALELAVRRAAWEMNQTLSQILPSPSPGTYSPESTRLASAGAWMNMRSAP